jgi:hypothetical protein
MARRLFIAGLVVALSMPAVFLIGMAAHWAMGCTGGGSSGPVARCLLLGIEFNWIASLPIPAFIAAFFYVPLGVLMCVAGLIAMAVSRKGPTGDGYGVYGPNGKLLTLAEASAAVANFDRTECDKLLRSFGEQPSTSSETLILLQARCIQVLVARRAYAS